MSKTNKTKKVNQVINNAENPPKRISLVLFSPMNKKIVTDNIVVKQELPCASRISSPLVRKTREGSLLRRGLWLVK